MVEDEDDLAVKATNEGPFIGETSPTLVAPDSAAFEVAAQQQLAVSLSAKFKSDYILHDRSLIMEDFVMENKEVFAFLAKRSAIPRVCESLMVTPEAASEARPATHADDKF